jgi:hypothetical protein
MIYSELRNFISMAASLETVAYFDKAIEIFEKYEVPDYMNILEATVGENTSVCDQDMLDQLTLCLSSTLNYLLNMQGIVLTEETLPSMTNAFIEGLFDIAEFEDQDAVLACLDSDETEAEKLCTLISFVTEYEIEQLLASIESVEEGFVIAFKERMQVKTQAIEQSAQDVDKQIKAYIKFKIFMNGAPGYADKYFKQLGSIGLPYEEYIKLYLKDRNNDLEMMSASVVAEELIALTCLSSDGLEAPLVTAKKYLNLLYSDITTITKVDIAITDFIVRMNHAQT